MRDARAVQRAVRRAHLRGDPGAPGCGARRGAGAHHRGEIAVGVQTRSRGCAALATRLRERRNPAGQSTSRGSGDHHSTGWPGEYHGKMPRSVRGDEPFGASGRRRLRAARRLAQRRSGGGNRSGGSSGASQVIIRGAAHANPAGASGAPGIRCAERSVRTRPRPRRRRSHRASRVEVAGRSRGAAAGRRSSGRTRSAPVRSRARSCARPACRVRSAGCRARCSSRCPGSSRPRNAGCDSPQRRPSSVRYSVSAERKNTAAATGLPAHTASFTSSASPRLRAICAKNSRLRYGEWPWRMKVMA